MRRTSRIGGSRLAPLAFITTAAVALGVVGLTAAPASALDSDVAVSEGQLLNGSGAVDTDTVADAAPAYSATPSGAATDNHPLDLTAAGLVNLNLGSGVSLLGGANPVLQLGVDGQYAKSDTTGASYAASGAINNDGSIDAGAGSDPTADTTVNLSPLLDTAGVDQSVISALEVKLGAISASATGASGTSTGDYQVAGGHLILTSPAVGTFTTTLTDTLNGVTDDLNGVLGQSGVVSQLTGALSPIGDAIARCP